LAGRGVADFTGPAFVCPYSETNANIRQAMQATGFQVARSHMAQRFPSVAERLDICPAKHFFERYSARCANAQS